MVQHGINTIAVSELIYVRHLKQCPDIECSIKVKYHFYHNPDIIQVLDFSTFKNALPLAYLEKISFISHLLLSQFLAAGASLCCSLLYLRMRCFWP